MSAKATASNSKIRSAVIFADDQEQWHDELERSKEREIAKFQNLMAGCEIFKAMTAVELFNQIDTLFGSGEFDHVFVFLDLNFPTVQEGLECLNKIKKHENVRVRQIPVFVYSISREPEEVSAVYARHGSGFYHKLEHPDPFWSALSHLDETASYRAPNPFRFQGVVDPLPRND